MPTMTGGCLPKESREKAMWPKSLLSCTLSSNSLRRIAHTVEFIAGHRMESST